MHCNQGANYQENTMKETFDAMHLVTLEYEAHKRTCGYWYLIQNHASAHTAFARRESLMTWLAERGLSLSADLPEHGIWSCQRINGKYSTESHLDYNAVMARPGVETRAMSNGQYTLAIIDEVDGVRCVHTLNPNCKRRPVFDYAESRAIYG
jgi:hypothetical protein